MFLLNLFQRGVHGLTFSAQGRHRDGGELLLVVQIKSVVVDDGTVLFCLWIQRENVSDDDNAFLSMSQSLNVAVGDVSLAVS